MALKAVVDKLDDVDEPFRGEYVQRGEKYELNVEIPGVEGVKSATDFVKINTALNNERKAHNDLKKIYAPLSGRKVDEIVTTLDRVPELEAAAAGKLDDTKLNELVETRIKGRLAPIERERDQYKAQVAEKDTVIGEYSSKDKTRRIHDVVRKAGTEAKILPEAMEDALMLADRTFELDDSGRVVVKEKAGFTQGIEPAAWFTDLQNKRGHWWGASQGGGAGGNRGGGGSSNTNPFSSEHWNMTEQGKVYAADPSKAEQLAKLAGTTIGGPRPKPKK